MCIRDRYMGVAKMVPNAITPRFNRLFGAILVVTLLAFAGLLVYLGIPDPIPEQAHASLIHLRPSDKSFNECESNCLIQNKEIYGPSWINENLKDFKYKCTVKCNRRLRHH
eukprot:TRINITY_DN13763_c0_g1_i1.p1 TRINITY_DN13763_c0_g1~~TRINITY_DN13763_c0_g1_i1.p1  ORF type:complete len:124 (-),score=20.56 TRINITY_DN13763_c0_g1_i1:130-462(-)